MNTRELLRNEEGSVLIVALVMLVLLTIVGISASTTTSIEIQISGNEKFHKMAFYAADGGTEAGSEILEQNIEARGFSTATLGSATILNLDFWTNQSSPATDDIQISNVGGSQIGIKISGDSALSTGGAIQLIAGYEGKGKGAGGSGAYMVYNVHSRSTGPANAVSGVTVQWRHMI
ncbi:MAG: PilX N-terminal domain-containing pilus assembly protein [Pseudomonadota bacterium]